MVSDFSKRSNNGEGENWIGTGCWSNGLVNKWMGGKGVFWSFVPRTGDHWCSWWWTWWCTHGAARAGGTGRRLNHRCQQVCQIPTAPSWHPWHDQMLVPAPEIGWKRRRWARELGLVPRQAELSAKLGRGDDDKGLGHLRVGWQVQHIL